MQRQKDLQANDLNLPHLQIAYTCFGPGSFLKWHVDEHHEELKGTAGWLQHTLWSISWLVYLNPAGSWNSHQDGGQLHCFHRPTSLLSSLSPHPQTHRIGAQWNGDLQIGWLRATRDDPMERPIFLDGHREEADHCAMYVMVQDTNNGNYYYNSKPLYVTDTFPAHPPLYIGGTAGEILDNQLISQQGRGGGMTAIFFFTETTKLLF
jgi:hypothetical protein